jgi:hypothetical protein
MERPLTAQMIAMGVEAYDQFRWTPKKHKDQKNLEARGGIKKKRLKPSEYPGMIKHSAEYNENFICGREQGGVIDMVAPEGEAITCNKCQQELVRREVEKRKKRAAKAKELADVE